MTATLKRRARIARVRGVQHVQAAGLVAEAEARVVQLESSAQRLAALRGVLLDAGGPGSGQALAAAHELAGRLDQARAGLSDAIVGARAAVVERDRQRLAARIEQEGAEKLKERAREQAADAAERRLAALGRRRAPKEEQPWN